MAEDTSKSKPLIAFTPSGELALPCHLGHYRIVKLLGKGGMGQVYLAEDPALNRRAAVKILTQAFQKDPNYVRRFLNEAQSIARLTHPGIVSIYYIGRVGSLIFFAMEYVEGRSADDALRARGRFSIARALDITVQVAEALDYALEMGIIHRDIKPANLMMVERKGRVKVGDFGLAKQQENDLSLTQAGSVIGSPFYLSPEQGRGRPADHRSDIYSLGATLYHLISGRPPYQASTAMDMVLKHVNDPYPPIADLPEPIDQSINGLLERMMAKEPENRFPDYPSLIRAIRSIQNSQEATQIIPASEQPTDASPLTENMAPTDALPSPDPVTTATPSSILVEKSGIFNSIGGLLALSAAIMIGVVAGAFIVISYIQGNTNAGTTPAMAPTGVVATPTPTPPSLETPPTPTSDPVPTVPAPSRFEPSPEFLALREFLLEDLNQFLFTGIRYKIADERRKPQSPAQRAAMDLFDHHNAKFIYIKNFLISTINRRRAQPLVIQSRRGPVSLTGASLTRLTYLAPDREGLLRPTAVSWDQLLAPQHFYQLVEQLAPPSRERTSDLAAIAFIYQMNPPFHASPPPATPSPEPNRS